MNIPTKHTPGPWKLDGPYKVPIDHTPPNHVQGWIVMGAGSEDEPTNVANVVGPSYLGREEECDPELVANAHLLAAAPELLESTELLADALVERINQTEEETPKETEAIGKANVAIAKAHKHRIVRSSSSI